MGMAMSNLIDRQAAIDWLENDWNGMVATVFDGIRALPSVEPTTDELDNAYAHGYTDAEEKYRTSAQPRKGEWEEAWRSGFDGVRNWHWECSECGFELNFDGCIDPNETLSMYNFCPNCGAKMKSDEATTETT